jgi:hypothetical protein
MLRVGWLVADGGGARTGQQGPMGSVRRSVVAVDSDGEGDGERWWWWKIAGERRAERMGSARGTGQTM